MDRDRCASGQRWPAAWTHPYTTATGLIRRWIAGIYGGVVAGVTRIDAATVACSAAALAAALREDSNLELDWLWYATNMTSPAQRRVCLQRVLHINPHNEDAKRVLASLVGDEPA